MNSDSSLTLSWEDIPSSWHDARRNTEPIVFYKHSLNNVDESESGLGFVAQHLSEESEENSRSKDSERSLGICKNKETSVSDRSIYKHVQKRILGPFKTKVNVFKSKSNLFKVVAYSLLNTNPSDNI